MHPSRFRPSAVLASVVIASASLGACIDQTEPSPAPAPVQVDIRPPIVAVRPGPMVIVCRPDAIGCVPMYAVACRTESAENTGQPVRPLSPEEAAWCAAQPLGKAGTAHQDTIPPRADTNRVRRRK
ncbi:MAG: hypothetical protein HKM89_09520 [Gemmatimonadales bacterium]|nr:hypothetical protein [Gemmatimonadales bacterium]